MPAMVVFSWPLHHVPVFHLSKLSFAKLSRNLAYNTEAPCDRPIHGDHTGIDLNNMPILFASAKCTGKRDSDIFHCIHKTLVRECGFVIQATNGSSLTMSGYLVKTEPSRQFTTRAFLYPVGSRFLFHQEPGRRAQVTYPFIAESDETRKPGTVRTVIPVTTSL